MPRCISSLQDAQHLLLLKQTVDCRYLPIFRYTAAVEGFLFSNLSRLVLLNIFTEISIGLLVVESHIRVADFRQVVPLCVITPMRLELTVVFRTKHCSSLPKIMQIDSGDLKM